MNVKPILDLIARYESESSVLKQHVDSAYDVVVTQAFNINPPKTPISTMPISEVLQWQSDSIKKYQQYFNSSKGYSAVGRYQIIRSTLESLAKICWKASSIFNANTQDELATELLRRRGLDAWIKGKISNDRFADSLSQEWASLPFNTGYSYYAGDSHGNRSLVTREEVLKTLHSIKTNNGA